MRMWFSVVSTFNAMKAMAQSPRSCTKSHRDCKGHPEAFARLHPCVASTPMNCWQNSEPVLKSANHCKVKERLNAVETIAFVAVFTSDR